jgi:DHA2 family multidrug resistance protein
MCASRPGDHRNQSQRELLCADAKDMALKQLMKMTHSQGLVMAFADVFFLLTVLFVALATLAITVKKPAAQGRG